MIIGDEHETPMRILATTWILLALTACSNGSDTSDLLENAKDVLDQHACLEGTWQADSQTVNIAGQEYSVIPNQSFMIISEPKDISELINDGSNSINYAGLNLRTWVTTNNQTKDLVAQSWVANLNSDNEKTDGTLKLINSCSSEYNGIINDAQTPQCLTENLSTTTQTLSLECSSDISYLTISNENTQVSFQRVHDNSSVTDFTNGTDNPVDIATSITDTSGMIASEDLLNILKDVFPELSDAQLQAMLNQAMTLSFPPQSIAPSSPTTPEEPPEPSTPPVTNNDTDNDGIPDDQDRFPDDPNEWADLDNDRIGDNSDDDIDGDSYPNDEDMFPTDNSEWADLDRDGMGDNSDNDIDGDGFLNEVDPAPTDPSIPSPVALYAQDFESFVNTNWQLTQFNLPEQPVKTDYTKDGSILFQLQWTKRTRRLLADKLGYQRSEMTNELANTLCPPRIEVGRESTYQGGTSNNLVAELDSDLNHCGMSGDEPASIKMRSFVATKIGYRYRLSADYKMRRYRNQPANAYRHFVMGFAGQTEHYAAQYDTFKNVQIEITASQKFSKVILLDNGLPDSYGILIDNIQIHELGKVPHYDNCAAIYTQNSKGFKHCIKQEVDTNQVCDSQAMSLNYQPKNVIQTRANSENLFLQETADQGHINFVSLGKRGKLTARCLIDGYPALLPVFNKRLSLREISWGNANPNSYPEQGRISVNLSHCLIDELNGHKQLGVINTSEFFTYDFTANEAGLSYEGCRLKQLIIKDKTPQNSPSTDGIDLNSFNISDLE